MTKLSSTLESLTDAEMRDLLASGDTTHGWGTNHVVEVQGERLFVKRIPVTELEYAHPMSTRNLYALPTYYNYGVGSAGFGAYREILAHIKTTEWVREGLIDSFPLMYHYRVVPFEGERSKVDPARRARTIRYWAGNEAIERYLAARDVAPYEAILFLEYVPHSIGDWLNKHPDRLGWFIDEMGRALRFLHARGVAHMDAHFGNILTDGERVILTDYGLVLDAAYDLSEAEHAYLEANKHYDLGEMLAACAWHLTTEDDEPIEQFFEDVPADNAYRMTLLRYKEPILFFDDFIMRMRSGPKKDHTYDHARLVALLKGCGLL